MSVSFVSNGSELRSSDFRIENNVLIGREKVPTSWIGYNSIGESFLASLIEHPDIIGQIDAYTGEKTTHAQMREQSVKCALWMRKQGIGPGDIVAVCTHHHLDEYIPCLAALYVGAVLNAWDDKMNAAAAKKFLTLTNPKVIFANESSARILLEAFSEEKHREKLTDNLIVFDEVDGLKSLKEILKSESSSEIEDFQCTKIDDRDQTALLMYSSGTTGVPKAAEVSHNRFFSTLDAMEVGCGIGLIKMWTTPLYWITALFSLMYTIITCSTRVVIAEFEEETLCQIIEKYQVSWLLVGTSAFNKFAKSNVCARYKLPSLNYFLTGGSIVTAEAYKNMSAQLPHVRICSNYGMTEIGGISGQFGMKHPKPGSVGIIFSNMKLKVIDIQTGETLSANQSGEICVKAANYVPRYYRHTTEESVDSEGWLHTGDLGYYDEDGEIFVIDRLKDLIKYKGFHVSPTEIEELLISHPAVMEAAVVSVLHPIDGEHPIAFVSKVPGKQVKEEELIELVEKNLVDHKRLRGGVKFVEEFPRTPNGKIAKSCLKEIARSS